MSPETAAKDAAARLSSILPNLEELAASSEAPHSFFEELMVAVASVLNADAAACWMHNQQQMVARLTDIKFDELDLSNDLQATRLNQSLLAETIRTRKPQIHPIKLIAKPAVTHVVLLPISQAGICIGAMEFFAAGAIWQPLPDDARDLGAVSGLMEEYLEKYEASVRSTDPAQFLDVFESFTQNCHANLDPFEVATTVVNDAVSILQCDRASLLVRRGSSCKVLAISGKTRVNRRSNQIVLLQELTQQTVATREVLTWSGSDTAIPPQLTGPLAAYVDKSASRMIRIHPLFHAPRGAKVNQPDDADRRPQRELMGALVLEQFASSQPHPVLAKYSSAVSDQVSTALSNAFAYQRIPLLSVFDTFGRGLQWIRGRGAAILAAVVLSVTSLAAGLLFTPAEYRVEASGKLMPAVQRRVFAPYEGEVHEILVEPGELVSAGAPLISLKNEELDSELLLLRNQQISKQKGLHGLTSELHNASGSQERAQVLRLQADVEAARIDLETLNTQIEHTSRRIEQLTLRAPIGGTVVTFVNEQQLIGRPVNRGEALLEVMDENSGWQLELEVPENRMQHVRQGQNTAQESMSASFRLAASPTSEYTGKLTHVAERTTISADNATVVKVRVSLNQTPMLERRIGADVRARLECGEYSLMYVLFGDAVEFAQRHLWF